MSFIKWNADDGGYPKRKGAMNAKSTSIAINIIRNRVPMVRHIVMLSFIEFFREMDREFDVKSFKSACQSEAVRLA